MLSDYHVRELVAGTVGGWAQVVVGHPFDTVKVRLQTQPNPPLFRGPLDCVRKTVTREGVRGLFKGVYSPLMGIGICNATLFSTNENFRRLLQAGDPGKELTLSEMTLAGALSGAVLALVLCPMELVKIRMQVQYEGAGSGASAARPYTGVMDCTRRTFHAEGMRGLFRGLNLTMLREIPSTAAYFGTYEALKELLILRHPDNLQHPRTLDLLLAGGIAGQMAWVTCYPQDVVKSRMQMEPAATRRSMWYYTQELWHTGNRNWRVFFKGFGTAMVRAFPANAATFFAYENVMEMMEIKQKRRRHSLEYDPQTSLEHHQHEEGDRRRKTMSIPV
ncbi:mitochondrial carrier domain-containing protein [Thamnocephalis sphaerospora]|uniref:Mitochondrial carrier domain-containing protein n=1 Tax=Thamnocephalis sphaerospora TaxID=78915 RepID=A0A4P9XVC1_9FUNG|nr:mitochondrial carrier domain-containing protein [Thamnocephalis sphaerospora]|eukprot:RKP10217.1 mitochondrial carrier domain-containing protein [Thamnocephalis sphaerospora]